MMLSATPMPMNFSDLRELVARSAAERESQDAQLVDPDAARRNQWPHSFVDYDSLVELEELLPRCLSLMNKIRKECKLINGRVDADDSRMASTKDPARNIFAVHATAIVPTTIPSVLHTLVGPHGTQFDAFLSRLFGEKLEHAAVHRHIGVDSHGKPWQDPRLVPQRNVAISSFYFDESTLFKKITKEVVYLDYMHIHSNMRAVSRVFKTIDNDASSDRRPHVDRIRHVLFGYVLERMDESHVRISYYGEYCLNPNEPTKHLKDAKHLLERLGSSVQLLQRILTVKSADHAKWCRTCLKSFSLFRQAITCSACGVAVCGDCVVKDEVATASGTTFEVRLCSGCVNIHNASFPLSHGTVSDRRRSSSRHSASSTVELDMLQEDVRHTTCTLCLRRPAAVACCRCMTSCCRVCAQPEPQDQDSFACTLCRTKISPLSTSRPGEFAPDDFIDRQAQDLLLRISEGDESDHRSPLSPSPKPSTSNQPECERHFDPERIRTAAVLDLETNDALDALCLRAATRLECTYGFVNLLYKGSYMLKGVAAIQHAAPTSIPRDCALSTHSTTLPLLVPDAEMDPRFATSPLVTGKEHIRFFYGLPLVTSGGIVLGTVAVADIHPRVRVSSSQRNELLEFAHDAISVISRRLRYDI